MTATAAARNEVMSINERDTITDAGLLIKSAAVLGLVILGFIAGGYEYGRYDPRY